VVPVGPERRGSLRMYSCGPAVDRPVHLGDLRSCLLSDLIRRTLEWSGRTVTSAQNITDVGHLADGSEPGPAGTSKVAALTEGRPQAGGQNQAQARGRAQNQAQAGGQAQNQAQAGGQGALDVARHHEEAFRADCAALNIRPAEFTPRASESIGLMTDLIGRLLASGHAYQVPSGSVYFAAQSVPDYGVLSGIRLTDLPPGDRSGHAAEPGQRSTADWALWQAAPAGRELTWPAPWGTGFPGWPTECSALSLHFLGESIDVHTSGIDLRFPHDEQERAQSNSVTGHEAVQHWAHSERLLFDGDPMASPTGNVVLLGDVEARKLDPLAVRLAVLEHRYRQPVGLTWDTLAAADAAVRRWRDRVAEWANSPSRPMCAQYVGEFIAALEEDLDTPAALRSLRSLESDSEIPPGSKFETFAFLDQVLGLDLARDIGKAPAPRPRPPGAG